MNDNITLSLESIADGNDLPWISIEKRQNNYYQKQLANQIKTQANDIISKLTSSFNIHLNIGQDITMNTTQVFMSLETKSIESLLTKQIKQVGENAKIIFPSYFNATIRNNSTISIRVCLFVYFFNFLNNFIF